MIPTLVPEYHREAHCVKGNVQFYCQRADVDAKDGCFVIGSSLPVEEFKAGCRAVKDTETGQLVNSCDLGNSTEQTCTEYNRFYQTDNLQWATITARYCVKGNVCELECEQTYTQTTSLENRGLWYNNEFGWWDA